MNAFWADHKTKKINCIHIECAFAQFAIKIIGPEPVKYHANIPFMVLFIHGVYEDVIKVDHHTEV